ncbi:hypothetical protein OSG_eHP23_00030 [environmental Halophage eHP-23]|nr:hypothetical protein OSG_eHP23_00030 [environmental Halophage eHP-23]
MAVTDYNKLKKLDIDSVSGTPTVDKAQPLIIAGESQNSLEDDIESGSTILDFESNANYSIDSNSEVNGTYSLQGTSSGSLNDVSRTLQSVLDTDGVKLEGKVKIDTQTGNSGDEVFISAVNDGVRQADVSFFGNGDISVNGTVVDSWSSNTIYDIDIVFEFSSSSFSVVINGTEYNGFSIGDSEIDTIDLRVDSSGSGSTVNSFFDDLTYDAEDVTDATTGNGDIVIDFTNISGPEDIAVYDQNGNLLDYEIEDLDTTAETGVLWCYNSWIRDGTTQAQVVYGDNSENEDRSQDGTGANAWSNSGENASAVYHNEESSTPLTDSTTNDFDSTDTNGIQFQQSGQFADAITWDGTDDFVELPSGLYDVTADFVASTWVKTSASATQIILGNRDSNFHSGGAFFLDSSGIPTVNLTTSFGNQNYGASTAVNDGEWHHLMFVYDRSAEEVEFYIDGVLDNTDSAAFDPVGNSSITAYGSQTGGSTSINQGTNVFNGTLDETRVYTSSKSAEFAQAEYDASPKAGQVFFTQQAAETTVQTQQETFTQDISILNRDVTEGFSQTVIIENPNQPETFTQDVAVANKDVQQTFNNDVAIKDVDVEQTFTQDVTVKDFNAERTFSQTVSIASLDNEQAFSQDVILSEGNQETFTQDVSLKALDQTKQASQDVIIEDPNRPETFTQDVAVANKNVEITFTQTVTVADIDNEETFTQDAVVSMRMERTFENSVVIAKQPAPRTENPLKVNTIQDTQTFVETLKLTETNVELKELKRD